MTPEQGYDGNNGNAVARTTVGVREAEEFLFTVVVKMEALADWGYKDDNPITFYETHVLHNAIRAELRRLEYSQRLFRVEELVQHLKYVAERAVVPVPGAGVVVEAERRGNPKFPPGYEDYVNWMCELVARSCFVHPSIWREVKAFVGKMRKREGVWWLEEEIVRDVV